VTTTYKSSAWADKVTFEQQWAGRTFVDTKALSVVNLLRAAMIAEETNLIFGQTNGSASIPEQAPGVTATPAPPTLASGAAAGSLSGPLWVQPTNPTRIGAGGVSSGPRPL